MSDMLLNYSSTSICQKEGVESIIFRKWILCRKPAFSYPVSYARSAILLAGCSHGTYGHLEKFVDAAGLPVSEGTGTGTHTGPPVHAVAQRRVPRIDIRYTLSYPL